MNSEFYGRALEDACTSFVNLLEGQIPQASLLESFFDWLSYTLNNNQAQIYY